MIALQLDEHQRAALEAPFDRCVAILGGSGTGKTTALLERAERARALHSGTPLIVTAQRRLQELALEILRDAGMAADLVDDVDAEALFAQGCAPLFALEWEEFAAAAELLDPEVPGLRSPQRFLESSFRLVRKLRDASIAPADFLESCLRGGAEFYAKTPNLADTALLHSTKEAYRDSLDVDTAELQRQYRREIDLAKILARLYERYLALVESSGRMAGRDAVAIATALLERDRPRAQALLERHPCAFVDDAQELTLGELALLRSIFGPALSGVTLAGDPNSAFSTFRGARPSETFATARERFELARVYRMPAVPSVYRAPAPRDEAEHIAAHVAGAVAAGTAPEEIAVILRSVAEIALYEDALLAQDLAVAVSGDFNVFADRRALDALALLWNVYDPFRHDWLLRTLGNPALGLSDASLAVLCAEPSDPQRALFALDGEQAPTLRSSRWDPKRDLRLGWNVVRGDQDAALSPAARERVAAFRRRREGWLAAMHALDFDAFATAVWSEGLAREGPPGSARARTQAALLEHLLERLRAFAAEHPEATAGDVLAYAQRRAQSELESCERAGAAGFVNLISVEASLGRSFERVVVADARAGGFPRWYVPDTFLYSPRYGMIPKENAGDGRAARTAKFTYYMFISKARETYNAQERRAFGYALRRARSAVHVTASGAPTRGLTAPEFLEELR